MKNKYLFMFVLILSFVLASEAVLAGCRCFTAQFPRTSAYSNYVCPGRSCTWFGLKGQMYCTPDTCAGGMICTSSSRWVSPCSTVSCGIKCGVNCGTCCSPDCPQPEYECGTSANNCGTCPDRCGNFKESCSGNTCVYQDASLTAEASMPCYAEAADVEFTVTGYNEYCGNLDITVDYGNGETDSDTKTGLGEYDYTSKTFVIPDSVDLLSSPDITVMVRGDRNYTKNSKDEDYYNNCEVTFPLSINFPSFYYCPKPTELPFLMTYDTDNYYQFYSDNVLYDWDECISDTAISQCTDNGITDCIDENNVVFAMGDAADADSDDEIEVCYSVDGKQGGWLDADANQAACNDVEDAEWIDCVGTDAECQEAVDDFADDKGGLCCGDEDTENYLSTPILTPGNSLHDFAPDIEFSACCDDASDCVDEFGNCRDLGYETCMQTYGAYEGHRAKCLETTYEGETFSYWNLSQDDTCKSNCSKCDSNTDGLITEIDLVAIENHYGDLGGDGNYDELYDIDDDNDVDEVDRDKCNFFFTTNPLCENCEILYTLFDDNVCAETDTETLYKCDDAYCVLGENNNRYYTRTGCDGLCLCEYSYSCNTEECGGCEDDGDCTTIPNQECNDKCACVDYPPGEEFSAHIYTNDDCTYSICISGDPDTLGIGKGTIKTSTNFTDVEGDNWEEGDTLTLSEDLKTITFEARVKGWEDCINFSTGGRVTYDFEMDDLTGQNLYDIIYFETSEDHPDSMPFTFTTPDTNECRTCEPTEDYETILDDDIDNDCDGLIDEPHFDEPGLYIFEGACKYQVVSYADDYTDYVFEGEITTTDIFTDVEVEDWEAEDSYTAADDLITFTSKIEDDEDRLFYETQGISTFDITEPDIENIYLTDREINPIENPFDYSDPDCNLECSDPSECGDVIMSIQVGCTYEECLFACGGYWVDTGGAFGSGDYCAECQEDMGCGNYTNEASCNFDPCYGSRTRYTCEWDDEFGCYDPFIECAPGETLCSDGKCRYICEENAECIGEPDGECELGEGCACEDCEDEQDSCVDGAVCGENEYCGCPPGTTLCNDGVCDDTCEDYGNKTGCFLEPDGYCEPGEGCACEDCAYEQDGCTFGAVCHPLEELCVELSDGGCPEGTALCQDGSCDETCEDEGGKMACIGTPDLICDTGEGCACADCENKRDSCAYGLVCDADTQLCAGNETIDDDAFCVDNDQDGYYKFSILCPGSDDCNDNNKNINPGVLEVCDNGVDDDCDGLTDENCGLPTIEIKEDFVPSMRVLTGVDLEVKVNNNFNREIDILEVELGLPYGITANKRNVVFSNVMQSDKETAEFELYVKNIKSEQSILYIAVRADGVEENLEVPLTLTIPDFLVAEDPQDKDKKCKDYYYVLNDPSLKGMFDMEFFIEDKNALLSKTLIVDYINNVDFDDNELVKPMISNPYCFSAENYVINGQLYRATPGLLVDTVDISKDEPGKNNKLIIDVNII